MSRAKQMEDKRLLTFEELYSCRISDAPSRCGEIPRPASILAAFMLSEKSEEMFATWTNDCS